MSPFEIMMAGKQAYDEGRKEYKTNKLNELASQLYMTKDKADQKDLVSRAISINPESGYALEDRQQEQKDRELKILGGHARYVKNALDTKDPNVINGAWAATYPKLVEEGMIDPQKVTAQWNDRYTPYIHQVLAMTNGGDSAVDAPAALRTFDGMMLRAGYEKGSEEYNKASRIFANLDPKARAQIVLDESGGYNVASFGGGAPPTASPLMQGGQPQPQAQPQAQPQVISPQDSGGSIDFRRRDGSVKEEILQQINALTGVSNEQRTALVEALYSAPQVKTGIFNQDPRINISATASASPQIERRQLQAPKKEVTPKTAVAYDKDGNAFVADVSTPGPIQGAVSPDARKAANAGSKPLPVQAIKLIEEAQDAAGSAAGANILLNKYIAQIGSGKLNLGLAQNLGSKFKTFTGNSDDNSRNYSSFEADLEGIRNSVLLLNKGVQTEGDSTRAMNQIIQNKNDGPYVKKRLEELQQINKRAEKLQKEKIQRIKQNYKGVSDESDLSSLSDEDIMEQLSR